MNGLGKRTPHWTACVLCVIVLGNLHAQPQFAQRGVFEFGGSVSFLSTTAVNSGATANAITSFRIEPFLGYFVADGCEIGLNPFGMEFLSFGGSTLTQVFILLAPSYHFRTEGFAHPFVEALLGYTSQSNGASRSGFSWGGRAGVKFEVVKGGLLNVAAEYLRVTMNPSGATQRSGSNQLSISLGVTLWK